MSATRVYLLDANIIMEAVRTATWPALTGGLRTETVREVAEECRRGDEFSSGYTVVTQADLDRLCAVHDPTPEQIAAVLMMPESSGLDPGERDLFAYVLELPDDDDWLVCSADLACIRFLVAAGYGDRIVALEQIIEGVGGKATPALRTHFTTTWLSERRTQAILDNL